MFIFGYVAALFIKATMTAEAGIGHGKTYQISFSSVDGKQFSGSLFSRYFQDKYSSAFDGCARNLIV